jgi:hypothetical protein
MENGLPVVQNEVVSEMMHMAVEDMENFQKQQGELIERLDNENPFLAKAIMSQCLSMRMLGGTPDQASNYMMSCIVQILMMLEKSEEIYRKE